MAVVCIADKISIESAKLNGLSNNEKLFINCNVTREGDIEIAIDTILKRING